MTNTCVIYTRVSTEAQSAEGTSLEGQLRECRTLASGLGLTVAGELRDVESGTGRVRPGFTGVCRMMRDGEVASVVAWKEDRLYRGFGVVPFFEALQTLPNAREFRVHLVHGNWDYSNFLIMAGIAQKELEDFRLRSMEGKRREVANGRVIVFGRPPFGYRAEVTRTTRGRITDSQLVVVEDQAVVVRRIFSEFTAGVNMEQIAVGLTNDGIPSHADWHANVPKPTHGRGT